MLSCLYLAAAFINSNVVHSYHDISKRGAPYAQFDPNRPTMIAYDEGSFKYPFNSLDWFKETTAKGLTIHKLELDKIYQDIGASIEGGYASLTRYVKPDTVTGNTGDYIYGAWKIQVMVEDYVWKYRIAQGERFISCKQDWQDKIVKVYDALFFEVKDVEGYKYWTDGVTCTFGIISPRITQIVNDIDTVWNQRNIGHYEL
eukprot:152018_1